MPPEVKELQELNKLVVDIRTEHEKFVSGAMTKADYEEKSKKMFTDFDGLKERIADIETKMARPPIVLPGADKKDGPTIEAKAYDAWLRKGNGVSPEEQKALRLSDDTTGGYLTTPEMEQGIIKGLVQFSPIRSVARVRTTGKTEVWARKRTGTFAARWIPESGVKSETSGLKYGLEKIPTHELYADVPVSNWDLEDSDFNLESELSSEFSEQFGVAEGAAFLIGNSVNKPEGILANAAVLAAKIAGDTSGDLSVTDILNVYYGLPEPYASNGSWLFKRSTTQKVVLFKDAANHYIWMPSLVVNMPSTLLGRPIVECIDMPAVAANAYAVLFGDFRRAYLIVDRLGIATLRDPYTLKLQGQVEFTARKRVGGQIVLSEAIRVLQIKA